MIIESRTYTRLKQHTTKDHKLEDSGRRAIRQQGKTLVFCSCNWFGWLHIDTIKQWNKTKRVQLQVELKENRQ